MAYEKRLVAVSPQAFTSNSIVIGQVKIADTTLFKVKQQPIIQANTLPNLDGIEIKEITDINTMYVGPIGGSITTRTDISAYTTALSAAIFADLQQRPNVPEQSVLKFAYAEEPAVAIRNLLVNKLGEAFDSITDVHGIRRLAVDAELTVSDIEIGTVDQGNPNTLANAWPVKPTDGINSQSFTGAGEAKVSDDSTHTKLDAINTTLGDIDTDLLVFKSANHTDLTQIDTDILAFKAVNHLDLTQIDTDLLAFEAANHTDLVQIDSDLLTFKTANHIDLVQLHSDNISIESKLDTINTNLTTIDTDLNSFKNANHADLVVLHNDNIAIEGKLDIINANLATIDTDINSFKSANHTDLVQIDTDLLAFKTANHTDLLSIKSDIDSTNTKLDTIHSDLVTIEGKQDTGNASLASIDGKLVDNYGVATVALRTAAQIGNATGAALFGAGTTTAQVLRVVLPTDQTAIPFTPNSDYAPATQNVTTQDIASSTTLVANGQSFITGIPTIGSVASFSISSLESVEVQVTGTWTGTLQTEFSIDGGTTWFTRGVKQAGSSYISSSFTANFAGGANIAAVTNYRVRAIAAMTGTAIVKIVASVNLASTTVTNALILRDSVIQSNLSSITSTGDLRVNDGIRSGGIYGNISLATANTPIEVKIGGSRLTNRKLVTIVPTDADMFWGYDSGVTTANGTPIFKNQLVTFDMANDTTQIWLVCATNTRNARITEAT